MITKSNFEKLDCFVPPYLAFELKKIGFNEECLLQHTDVYQEERNFINFPYDENTDISIDLEDCTLKRNSDLEDDCLSLYKSFRKVVMIPTWEQVLEWFSKKGFYGIVEYEGSGVFVFGYIVMDTPSAASSRKKYSSYKEAREQLIVELIKVYKIGCPKLH